MSIIFLWHNLKKSKLRAWFLLQLLSNLFLEFGCKGICVQIVVKYTLKLENFGAYAFAVYKSLATLSGRCCL
jgi:hypothetical protein